VIVYIEDVNDEAPVFTQQQYSRLGLRETAGIGTSVIVVRATDRDSGEEGRRSRGFPAQNGPLSSPGPLLRSLDILGLPAIQLSPGREGASGVVLVSPWMFRPKRIRVRGVLPPTPSPVDRGEAISLANSCISSQVIAAPFWPLARG
jgi:hypothetical protein